MNHSIVNFGKSCYIIIIDTIIAIDIVTILTIIISIVIIVINRYLFNTVSCALIQYKDVILPV